MFNTSLYLISDERFVYPRLTNLVGYMEGLNVH